LPAVVWMSISCCCSGSDIGMRLPACSVGT
jgi:hypothetical protein